MKQFKIYANPRGTHEAVKQGWSWPAFLFGVIWALVKQMWVLGFGLPGFFFVLGFIAAVAGGDFERGLDGLTSIGGLVVAIVFGINGNTWREANLTSRGFEFKETVSAANDDAAIAVYEIFKK
ncbi:MAG: DUF2628 domain-containing protein [bacterium]|nr:DUF2628 domain-containing protein [bacterium]